MICPSATANAIEVWTCQPDTSGMGSELQIAVRSAPVAFNTMVT
jgi:hypothetical protein